MLRFCHTLKTIGTLCVVFASTFAASAPKSPFDANLCRLESRPIILCFDLRDDLHPKAGLVVFVDTADKKELRFFLPFHTTDFESNRTILASWGNYETFTSITFLRTMPGVHGIGFDPIFDPNLDLLDEPITGAALILQKVGLERRFSYQHHLASRERDFPPEVQAIGGQSLDAIAVVRPNNATGLELRNGKTEEPEALPESGAIRYYPAVDVKGSPSRVMLRYEVPPTPIVTLLLSNIPKIGAALVVPFFAILFFGSKDNVHPRIRKILLGVLGAIQLPIIGWLLYALLSTRSQPAVNAVVDWTILIFTAFMSALPLWLKREKLTVRP